MEQITTSTNHAHYNKLHKCVDKNQIYSITSSWINESDSSNDILDLNNVDIDNNLVTPRINKTHLKLVVQSDSGANCNLTNDIGLLIDVHDIPNTMLATCNNNDISNISTNKAGYMLLRDDTGTVIRTKVHYATESDGTVLSPTAITKQNNDNFDGWINCANNDTKAGKLVLIGRNGHPNLTFRTTGNNYL